MATWPPADTRHIFSHTVRLFRHAGAVAADEYDNDDVVEDDFSDWLVMELHIYIDKISFSFIVFVYYIAYLFILFNFFYYFSIYYYYFTS